MGERHLCFQCEADFPFPDPLPDPDSDPDESVSESLMTSRRPLSQSPDSSMSRGREGRMLHTPQYGGVRSLTHRTGESSAGTGSSLSQVPASELAQQSSRRIEAVERLLSDCFHASDNTEQRLSQLRHTQALTEAHVAHLTGRLTRQAALLEICTRGGGSALSHR